MWRARRGIPIPKALADRPVLKPHLLPVMEAYQEVCTSRTMGFGAGPIPRTELSAWCEDNGIAGVRRLRWIRMLRALDLAELTHHARGRKARHDDRPVPENPAGRGRGPGEG